MPFTLDNNLRSQLFCDIAANPRFSCEDIIQKVRPQVYSHFIGAVRNRYHYIKRQQKTKTVEEFQELWETHRAVIKDLPPDHWQKFADSQASPTSEPTPEETFSTEESLSPSNLQSSWGSSNKEQPFSSTPQKPPRRSSRLGSPPLSTGTPSRRQPSAAPIATPSPTLRNKMPIPAKKKTQEPKLSIFADLYEAEELVDAMIDVDTDYPESHGHGVHVLRVPESILTTTDLGTFVSDKIQFVLEDLVDITDYKQFKGQLVLNGTAFLITKPSVPSYLLKYYVEVLAKEKTPCDRTEHEFKTWLNGVSKDASRCETNLLFVFPEGLVCSADMSSMNPSAPTEDQAVKLLLREVPLDTENESGEHYPQVFYPGYFKLRVVRAKAKPVDLKKSPVASLADAFEGMA